MKVANRAEFSVLPNEKRIEIFKAETRTTKPVICVWNCPSSEEISQPRNGSHSDDFWLLYQGTIVPQRLPCSVIDALASLPPNVKLRIIGYETIGHQGYVESLQQRALALRVHDRVEFLGAIPQRSAMLEWAKRCDAGLALMPRTSDDLNLVVMVGASNKPFDYISAGLSLIVSGLPDWRATFVEQGLALECDNDDPASIASAVLQLIEKPNRRRQMSSRGLRKLLKAWNYEMQFRPVIKLLSDE